MNRNLKDQNKDISNFKTNLLFREKNSFSLTSVRNKNNLNFLKIWPRKTRNF